MMLYHVKLPYLHAVIHTGGLSDGEMDEWQPPTEAELKILQARRERQDKVSKLMGDYLLKGVKMLSTTCDACDVSN